MSRALNTVLVVGRFQPFHKGHLAIVRQALSTADRVLIAVGSAQESFTVDNPLTAGERIQIIEAGLYEALGEDWPLRIRIYPVMDINMNKVWIRYLQMLLPPFDAILSGNSLVAELAKDSGLQVLKPEFYNRRECQGRVIRERAARGDPSWRSCIQASVLRLLDKLDFEGRLQRLGTG